MPRHQSQARFQAWISTWERPGRPQNWSPASSASILLKTQTKFQIFELLAASRSFQELLGALRIDSECPETNSRLDSFAVYSLWCIVKTINCPSQPQNWSPAIFRAPGCFWELSYSRQSTVSTVCQLQSTVYSLQFTVYSLQ